MSSFSQELRTGRWIVRIARVIGGWRGCWVQALAHGWINSFRPDLWSCFRLRRSQLDLGFRQAVAGTNRAEFAQLAWRTHQSRRWGRCHSDWRVQTAFRKGTSWIWAAQSRRSRHLPAAEKGRIRHSVHEGTARRTGGPVAQAQLAKLGIPGAADQAGLQPTVIQHGDLRQFDSFIM